MPRTGYVLLAIMTATSALQSLAAQQGDAGTVYALVDTNEWCPAGSVYIDLATGSYMLHPQLPRDTCTGLDVSNPVEQGKLNSEELQGLRSAYADAQRVGLRARACVLGENREIMLSNAGPRVLALTGPAFSAVAPDNEACWTSEARALHSAVERIFERSERRAN